MFALLIHIYYQDSWEKLFKENLKKLKSYSPIIMINICDSTTKKSEIIYDIKTDFPNAFIVTTPNKGKDIGGKLALIYFFIETKQQAEFIVFLHDKMSPYSITVEKWRQKLFNIIDPIIVKNIIKKFRNDSKLGVLGAKNLIVNEYDSRTKKLDTINGNKLNEIIVKYNLKVKQHDFIAGTMFWIRVEIIERFFSKYSALLCREDLENGEISDHYESSYTHSWERILSWISTSQGYLLKGI